MSLTSTLSSSYDATLALVYPQACAVCGRSVEARAHGIACSRCWQETRIFGGNDLLCWKCGVPTAGSVDQHHHERTLCHRCDWAAFTTARATGVYEKALRAAVLVLKHEPHICAYLLRLLQSTLRYTSLSKVTRIVPVPLHPQREKARGFNQAAVIARKLSQLAKLPLDQASLVRVSYSQGHRSGMDRKARRDSVVKAFEVRYPRLISGERVLLVDDVFTTGATVSSCAQALISAGAREVCVITIARTLYL